MFNSHTTQKENVVEKQQISRHLCAIWGNIHDKKCLIRWFCCIFISCCVILEIQVVIGTIFFAKLHANRLKPTNFRRHFVVD